MAVSEAHKRASNKWNSSRDNIMIRPNIEEGAAIRAAAAAAGISVQAYILRAVRAWMEREGSGTVLGDLPAGGVDAEDIQRMTESATEGGVGSDADTGVVSIFFEGNQAPQP